MSYLRLFHGSETTHLLPINLVANLHKKQELFLGLREFFLGLKHRLFKAFTFLVQASQIFLKISSYLQAGEDLEYSGMAKVELSKMFYRKTVHKSPSVQIKAIHGLYQHKNSNKSNILSFGCNLDKRG